MTPKSALSAHDFERIRSLDTCTVSTIPHEIVAEIPKVAAALIAEECELIELCRSPASSLRQLATRLQKMNPGRPPSTLEDSEDR